MNLLSCQNRAWLTQFKFNNGRKPRILHIGNIANNAYNNAKLLNEAGLDCDVICYDYYHIMGCPEWEDADFSNEIKDHFRPDWRDVALGGFVRPIWFAQGPVRLCIEYLVSRRRNQKDAHTLWKKLNMVNLSVPENYFDFDFPLTADDRFRSLSGEFFSKILKDLVSRLSSRINIGIISFFVKYFVRPKYLIREIFWFLYGRSRAFAKYFSGDESIEERLLKHFQDEFPDRSDALTSADVQPHIINQKKWRELLDCYDIILAYSTDPIIPLISQVPYFAFEHGTIREIPYHRTAQGRLTALAYRLAKHVFVTNFDCCSSAEILAPGRFTTINHPYDEDHGLQVDGWKNERKKLLNSLDSEFLFFHPTRQDWVEGSGYADKGNDIFLQAFVGLRSEGFKVGLVCCSWGSNVDETKEYLERHHCSPFVSWVPPLAITPFERMCRAADCVVDQFKLGSFGGVVFKAMAVGTPILTHLNEDRLLRQYPVVPPVINCQTSEEIMQRVKPFISSPQRLAPIGEKSRAWMKEYHTKSNTINAQVDQFRLNGCFEQFIEPLIY